MLAFLKLGKVISGTKLSSRALKDKPLEKDSALSQLGLFYTINRMGAYYPSSSISTVSPGLEGTHSVLWVEDV